MTDLCDRMIIASGDSSRQKTTAIANNVSEKVKDSGGTVYGIEGEQVVEWVLVTWGCAGSCHAVRRRRSHYNLEELRPQARKIRRTAAGNPSANKKRSPPASGRGSAKEEIPGPASPRPTPAARYGPPPRGAIQSS